MCVRSIVANMGESGPRDSGERQETRVCGFSGALVSAGVVFRTSLIDRMSKVVAKNGKGSEGG
jgi:hypothetical protein